MKNEILKLFEFCGELKNKFAEDIETMQIPFEFLINKNPLPSGFGYNSETDKYVAYQQRERANVSDPIFETENKEEFRFFILKSITNSFGFAYELENRKELEKQWKYNLNIKERKLEENNGEHVYNGIYDHRKPAFEKSLQLLFKVFSKQQLEKQVNAYLALLNDDKKRYCIEYAYNYDKKEFIQSKNYNVNESTVFD